MLLICPAWRAMSAQCRRPGRLCYICDRSLAYSPARLLAPRSRWIHLGQGLTLVVLISHRMEYWRPARIAVETPSNCECFTFHSSYLYSSYSCYLLFVTCYIFYPAKTKFLHNICTILGQRWRRWTDVVLMLYKYFLFAGYAYSDNNRDKEQIWASGGYKVAH